MTPEPRYRLLSLMSLVSVASLVLTVLALLVPLLIDRLVRDPDPGVQLVKKADRKRTFYRLAFLLSIGIVVLVVVGLFG